MPQPGMLVKFTTRPETADAFAAILERALPTVERESGTKPWIAIRAEEDPTTFYLVDLFTTPADRDAHLQGEAAALILGQGGELLAAPAEVVPATLVAGKAI
jgi:quinol monooxygenase YgiN